MHEMALTESLIRILEEQAVSQGYGKVRRVWLELGRLSTVDAEALCFCFEVVRSGTIADEAVLEIISLPGQAFCLDCGKPVEIAGRTDPCPDCGGYGLQVTGGDEMRIKELEVE